MLELLNSPTGIIISIVLFLITREIWTWFFKLNTIVKQNAEIVRLLCKLAHEPEPLLPGEKLGRWLRRKK